MPPEWRTRLGPLASYKWHQKWPVHTLGRSPCKGKKKKRPNQFYQQEVIPRFWSEFIYWGPSAVSPAPQAQPSPAALIKLHPEDPPGGASIWTSPPRPMPPAPGAPASTQPESFQGLEVRKPLRSGSFQFVSAPIPPSLRPRSRDPLSQAQSQADTHLFSHGPGGFPLLAPGLGRKQSAQLVLTKNSSVRRRLLLLLPAILRYSGGNAGSWQPPPPPAPPHTPHYCCSWHGWGSLSFGSVS